ncbi:metallophosphoesterase [uncultured Modestobacter sp.]|uniref:metallophosphoesterase n=1 Tax=uncultured Modestobacter sp. TaxID=380048 RepID=UPI00261ED1AF|nr:metallophosphoesterase [uncultured Modestobacter sp.]
MRRWWVRAVLALTAAVALLLGWGVLVEPRLVLDQERLEVALPQLSGEWTGTELAVLSDLQVGAPWANTGMVERAVAAVVAAEPDAVLLAGDLVHGPPATRTIDPGAGTHLPEAAGRAPNAGRQVEQVLELLAPLAEAGLATYAVLGDHDLSSGAADELTRGLTRIGVPVLRDEARRLPPPTGEQPVTDLWVVGLDAVRPDTTAAFAGVPDDAPRVVLVHDPTGFRSLPTGHAPLTLAGHTRCGQLGVPGLPRWSRLGLDAEDEAVADGWSPAGYGAPGNRLYVTCGIGFDVAPIRLLAPPQVVFVELTPASAG